MNDRVLSPIEFTDWLEHNPLLSVMGLCIDEALLDLVRKQVITARLVHGTVVFDLKRSIAMSADPHSVRKS